MEQEQNIGTTGNVDKEAVNQCTEEIKQTLTKYNCFLDVSMTLTTKGIFPNIMVVPKPEEDQTIVEG